MLTKSHWMHVLVLVLLSSFLSQSADICFSGSRLYSPTLGGPDVCVPCQDGQFMPEDWHTHKHCYPCTHIKNPQLERLASPCTRHQDTGIQCIDGYYRTQPHYPQDSGHCQKCTQCPFPKLPCQRHADTVCCHGDNYGVYINKDGHPVCVRECGAGQYLDPSLEECLPCLQNSYMSERKHINTHCYSCEVPKSDKEKVVRACNATHSAVIGCVDGYYRSTSKAEQTDDAECLKLCGRGQYLDSTSQTCRSCHENTYMDEEQHVHTDRCKSCTFPEPLNQRVLQPCNSTHPTVIGCVDGYFHEQQSSGCVPCRKCSESTDSDIYEGRACEQSKNCVCCPQPHMAVVDTVEGPLCVPDHKLNTTVCGEGEHLSFSTRTYTVVCLPCPKGTFMKETNHTNGACKSCEEFSDLELCSTQVSRDAHQTEKEQSVLLLISMALMAVIMSGICLFIMYLWLTKLKKWEPRQLPVREFDEQNSIVEMAPLSHEATSGWDRDNDETESFEAPTVTRRSSLSLYPQ